GLDDQTAAERLEHDGDVEARAAEAAVGLGEQRADDAEIGELAPQLGAVPGVRARDAVACFERVLLGDEAADHVRQHAAVFGMGEVHSPRIALAMMLRWISLEPPKIDSLRLLKYCAAALAAAAGPT